MVVVYIERKRDENISKLVMEKKEEEELDRGRAVATNRAERNMGKDPRSSQP